MFDEVHMYERGLEEWTLLRFSYPHSGVVIRIIDGVHLIWAVE